MGAVVEGINTYFKGTIESPQGLIKFSKDMDTLSLLSNEMSIANFEKIKDKQHFLTKAFSVGCRIVGYIFKLFKGIATGIVGWAKLLYSLARSYKELKVLYEDFKALASI